MRILVLGGTGMLGHKLVQVLGQTPELTVFSAIRRRLEDVDRFSIFHPERTVENVDATDGQALQRVLAETTPDVVINAVGLIKQLSADERDLAALNAGVPATLARATAELGFRLISISTDCVFSGGKGNYSETDEPDPVDSYGRSKLEGEVTGPNCLTIRTSVIGRELDSQHSLVEWFLAHRGGKVRGYSRAIYSGFPTLEFASILRSVILDHPDLNGLYHVSSEPITKFDLLNLLNSVYSAKVSIESDDTVIIDRSLDSKRFRTVTGFVPKPWNIIVSEMADDTTPYELFHSRV